MISRIKSLTSFLKHDVWHVHLETMPRIKSFFIRQLRLVLLAIRGFNEDKCVQQASALTYYTLLSVVPVVALAFAIAKGFGFDKKIEEQLLLNLAEHQEVAEWIITFSHSLLDNTKGGILAGVGVALLLWAVMKLLGNIESSFNDIWQIKKPRPWVRKFSDYLAIMLLAPVLVILTGSVTVFITTQVKGLVSDIDFLGPLVILGIKLVPYLVIWMLMTFIYMVMPNTRVNFMSALVAGIIAGTLFQLSEWAYIEFQVGVARYNTIYGSFAALPLFLMWVQIAWLIVLLGAEVSFAHQNIAHYQFETDSVRVSASFKRLINLLIANLLIKNFEQGKEPLTAVGIAQTLNMPIRLARMGINELVDCHVLSETMVDETRDPAYQPALGTDRLTVSYVLNALETSGEDGFPVTESKEFQEVTAILVQFREALDRSGANRLLRDI